MQRSFLKKVGRTASSLVSLLDHFACFPIDGDHVLELAFVDGQTASGLKVSEFAREGDTKWQIHLLETGARVLVLLDHAKDQLAKLIARLEVGLIGNSKWFKGMGSCSRGRSSGC